MEISLSELKDLMRQAGSPPLPDKRYGWIVLVLRNGFVFVGDARRESGIGYLAGYQMRYWSKRDGGLPEVASGGKKSDDRLDKIEGELEFIWSDVNVIGVLPCGDAWKK